MTNIEDLTLREIRELQALFNPVAMPAKEPDFIKVGQKIFVRTVTLYFTGEVVDVTGWLGGYNFQWAWSSGHAAGLAA